MTKIPDFTETEFWTVRSTVVERFRRQLEVQRADTEIRLSPHDRELTVCPALYWQFEDCHFLLIKTGPSRFHNQFFYSVREEYGTGKHDYDDIAECVIALLQAQADHARERISA